jgi:hypothetical protein
MLRVKVKTQNNPNGKVLVMDNDDFELFKIKCCNKLKIKNNPKNSKIFKLDGIEISSLIDIKEGEELIVTLKGENFLKKDTKYKKTKKYIESTEKKYENEIINLDKEKENYEEEQNERKKAFFKFSSTKFNNLPVGITEITDFLCLGSAYDAQDLEQLIKLKITHILNLAVGWKVNKKILEAGIYYEEILIEGFNYLIKRFPT